MRALAAIALLGALAACDRDDRDPDATVYVDFECPACRALMSRIADRADRCDGVEVRWRTYPLAYYPESMPAARAAVAADRRGRLPQFRASLLAATATDGRSVARAAEAAGVTAPELAAALRDPGIRAVIRRDQTDAVRAGVLDHGLPFVIIAGRPATADALVELIAARCPP